MVGDRRGCGSTMETKTRRLGNNREFLDTRRRDDDHQKEVAGFNGGGLNRR